MKISEETKREPRTPNILIRAAVKNCLSEVFADESGLLCRLDRWTRRRVIAENMAKMNLVLEATDPVEHCYQNLIREIDNEAEMGVLLANPVDTVDALRLICEDPGVSGALHLEMHRIAPVMFPDEYAQSNGDLGRVWASVQALYDRARLDGTVSEVLMGYLLDSKQSASDITQALISLFYSFHEEGIRRQIDVSSLLDARETQDLFVMVAEFLRRAGSYEDRASLIGVNAGTA